MKSDKGMSALVECIGKTSSLFWRYSWNGDLVRQPISDQQRVLLPPHLSTAFTQATVQIVDIYS